MIIAIDFDGTICQNEYPGIGALYADAKKVINQLHEDGHYIIIWTCRENERLLTAVNWLLENGIKFHRINDHQPENLAKYGGNTRKVYAHLYIDDKQVGGLPSWDEIYENVLVMTMEYNINKQKPVSK
ncbi:hypothetical protein LJC68_03320 [Bacteroidales bacterium OttesenSCG-928-B11]|nr:hypothetical protein [Bacteroidales bacterium OttesenSCG-928-C03]MDL2311890.1 hypothetical protein [Bacteroidales bacterium OttesenSCG-928-B11]MDL2326153.1 hypothetical protein [Bacteroidales bacterium OttesenSCG-928-A14]